MSADPVRLALLGAGRMGRFHAECLRNSAAVEVLAVADTSPSALDTTRRILGGVSTYETIGAAIAHPGVEACLIATPSPSHPADVRAAIDAGLHVLCEKPVSLDPNETRALADLARRTDRLLQVGFWRRFSPPWLRAHEAIGAGRIGTPLYIRLSQWDANPPSAAFCDPAVSGGLAVDCGVHEFDLAEWLSGEDVVEVRSWSLPTVDDDVASAGDVDNLVAVLRLTGGAVATVDLSRNSRYGDDVRTEILGSDGAIFIETLPQGRARIATAERDETLAGSEADDATVAGVTGQADEFAAAVRGAIGERPGAEESARATEIGLAVRHAAETGTTVRVAPPLKSRQVRDTDG